ncbi:VOC family protein [Chloroflexota bacterium]
MKPKGVNRVVFAVKDFDKAVALYSELFNTEFHVGDVTASAAWGIKVAVSWDAEIEIVSPLPDTEAAMGQSVAQFVEKNGGGVYSVVFSVDNVEEAYDRATQMGIRVPGSFEMDGEQLAQYLDGKFTKFKQYSLKSDDTCGVQLVLGQIEAR